MALRLLRAIYRTYPRACLAALAAASLAIAAPLAFGGPDPAPSAAGSHAILDRLWLDAYPEDERSEISVWVWLSNGVGVYQRGSAYRASFDVFAFERDGESLEMTFLQDEENSSTRFQVSACDERPPFDLCLVIERPARGAHRYYGFSDQSAYARELPEGLEESVRAAAR